MGELLPLTTTLPFATDFALGKRSPPL